MSSALDMSLDDLIKNNKKSSGGNFRGRGRGSGPGPARRFPNRVANRANPYSMGKPVQAPESVWQHDMFSDQVPAYSASSGRAAALETGTKLYISNLDYGVSNEDIKELFSEVGDLKRYSVHYDRSGRSKGTAEVVFSRKADAVAAVKRYHNVQLDGKPMKIEIVGTTIATPAAMPLVSNGTFGSTPSGVLRSGVLGRGGAIVRPRGGGGGGGGGGGRGWGRGGRGGRGKGRSDPVSAEDLDADLDKYHSEAMQEN